MHQPLPNIAALVVLAAADPSRPGVSDGVLRLTISETVARAAGLAESLIAADPSGVAPVPVLVDRPVSSVIGIIGVLLAGRAVVAIDAGEPVERTARTPDRLGAEIVVDATAGCEGAAAFGLPIVYAARVGVAVLRLIPVAGHALSCVLFTSGSTGEPKGVMYDSDAVGRIFVRHPARHADRLRP